MKVGAPGTGLLTDVDVVTPPTDRGRIAGHCHVGECGRPGRIRGVTTATPSYKGHRYPVEIQGQVDDSLSPLPTQSGFLVPPKHPSFIHRI